MVIWNTYFDLYDLVLSQTFVVCTAVKKQLPHLQSMALTCCAKKINQSPWPRWFITEDVKQQTNQIRDSSRKPWHSFGQQFSQWSQHIGSLTPVRRALKKIFVLCWGLQSSKDNVEKGSRILQVVYGAAVKREKGVKLPEDNRRNGMWLYREKTINIWFSVIRQSHI